MNKYFKPLDFLFYFNCVVILCWIASIFSKDETFPMWLKIVLVLVILLKQSTYIKWKNIFKQK